MTISLVLQTRSLRQVIFCDSYSVKQILSVTRFYWSVFFFQYLPLLWKCLQFCICFTLVWFLGFVTNVLKAIHFLLSILLVTPPGFFYAMVFVHHSKQFTISTFISFFFVQHNKHLLYVRHCNKARILSKINLFLII